MVITGPFFHSIPVLSLTERALQIALHLLSNPREPVFDGQGAATDPLAAPILVRLSFPNFVDFAAKRQHPPPQRIPKRDFHPRPLDIRCLQHHRQH